MALLRRGSSRISDENFNCRLQREKAKTGAITASLAWNDPSDLDLHAKVYPTTGGMQMISYRNKRAAGGYLDVDMHAQDGVGIVDEPVENIFWKNPPAGTYSVGVHLYGRRGAREGMIPFRAILKREGDADVSVEGALMNRYESAVECFRFSVDGDGEITMGKIGTPLLDVAGRRPARSPMRVAMGAMRSRPKSKAKAKAKGKAKARASKIATGKKSKVHVYKGEKVKTKGGLRKEHLIKSKDGKIVSIRKSEAGRNSKWAAATAKARAQKGYTGFKAIKRGGSFYDKAKEIMASM